ATLNACRTVTGASEIYVLIREGDVLRVQAAVGLSLPEAPVELPLTDGLEGAAFRADQTIQRTLPADDPAYFPMPGRQHPPGVRTRWWCWGGRPAPRRGSSTCRSPRAARWPRRSTATNCGCWKAARRCAI